MLNLHVAAGVTVFYYGLVENSTVIVIVYTTHSDCMEYGDNVL